MTRRRPLPLVALLGLLSACGHRGNPLPPLRKTPPPPTEFRLAQHGDAVELSAVAPAASVDGISYDAVMLEFLYVTGEADLERAGSRLRARATPGAAVSRALALPPPGTLLRVAVRTLARGEKSPRTATRTIVAQAAIEAPRGLEAALGPEKVTLTWQGQVPKAVPPPPAPKLPGAFLAPRTAAAPPAPAASGKPASAPVNPLPVTVDEGKQVPPAAPTAQTTAKPTPPPARTNGFWLYRRAATEAYDDPLTPAPIETLSHADSPPLGVKVCYLVRAVASTDPLIDSASSNEVCIERRDVTAPAAPAGLVALQRATGVEILWSPSSEDDLAGYRVYREIAGGPRDRIAELPPARTSYLDETAVPNQRRRYAVTAFDRAGNESAPTEPVEATQP